MSEPMIDGKGELSLEQCLEITDGWSVLSDVRPLVAGRLWKEIARLDAQVSALLRYRDHSGLCSEESGHEGPSLCEACAAWEKVK